MEDLTGTMLCTNPKIKPAFKKKYTSHFNQRLYRDPLY